MRAIVLPIAMLLCAPALADFKSHYKDGLRAAEKKNWADVERSMREALSQEPNSQARVRIYGMRFEPYLPHHYLALAASARNDCANVLSSLNNASHIAALAESNGGSALSTAERGMRSRCESAQVAAQPQNKPEQAPVTTPAPPSTSSPAVSNPVASNPRATPAVTVPEVPAKSLASTEIATARASVQSFRRDLSALRAELNRPELAEFSRTKQSELLSLTRALESSGADSERAISTQDSQLLARAAASARSGASSVNALRVLAKNALAAAAPAVRPTPPAALKQLAQLYFSGEFAKAAVMNVESLQGKALAHALLLRAASRFSLFVAQGETRPEQLQAVKDDLARAKRSDASVRPNAKYFSPRLIQLY